MKYFKFSSRVNKDCTIINNHFHFHGSGKQPSDSEKDKKKKPDWQQMFIVLALCALIPIILIILEYFGLIPLLVKALTPLAPIAKELLPLLK